MNSLIGGLLMKSDYGYNNNPYRYSVPCYESKRQALINICEKPNFRVEKKYKDYFNLGDTAPGFTLDAVVNGERTKISLSDYIGKWVVLFFYGSNFTFV